jgi:uncharacterized protein (TIGR02271 family)
MPDTTTADRTVTAFFDDRAAAESAMQRLRDVGLTDSSIRLTGGEEYAGRAGYTEDRGFWDGLLDFFFPQEDSAAYAEGIRRGGYLLSVSVPAEYYDRAVDILDDEGSVDLDERTSSWRGEGWSDTTDTSTGIGAGAAAGASAASFGEATAGTRREDAGVGGGATAGAGAGVLGGGAAGGDRASYTDPEVEGRASEAVSGYGVGREEEAIPVIEERLRVGKRDVSLGRVRVRSYMVEEPTEADVTLRRDRVEIERRPIDRPLEAGEEAFVDRTLEAEERTEEAVVGKEARVTEEIALHRESDERTETVSDTVRHTEVEIEDERDSDIGEEPVRRGR